MHLRPALLVLVLASSLPTFAWDNWKSRFTDGPSVGVLAGGDLPESRLAYGWQAGYDLGSAVALDLSYLTWEDEIPSSDLQPLGFPAGGKINLDNHSFALSARWHLLRTETWSTYAGGGVSYFLSNEEDKHLNRAISLAGSPAVTDADIELQDGFAPHLMGGGEISLSRHWEVFGEARLVFAEYDLETRRVSTLPDGRRVSHKVNEGYDYDHVLFRLGLNYRF